MPSKRHRGISSDGDDGNDEIKDAASRLDQAMALYRCSDVIIICSPVRYSRFPLRRKSVYYAVVLSAFITLF